MDTQDTSETLQARLFAAEQRLLAEGIPSYFEVILALQELHYNIQKRCRQVWQRGLEEFARAIGMPLDAKRIEDYAYPDSLSKLAMDGESWLGAKIRLPQNTGITYVTLEFRREESGQDNQSPVCAGYVAVEFNDDALWTRAWELVKTQDQRLERSHETWGIELRKPVPPERTPYFEDILADLLGKWSHLWQRVGGLRGR
ncbi:MAG TPA: hypothetical protein VIH59_11280 [Candidatus Tectomicrobia bacterium]|jgi:hypothetical protein